MHALLMWIISYLIYPVVQQHILLTWLNVEPEMISKRMPGKVWDGIDYPLQTLTAASYKFGYG